MSACDSGRFGDHARRDGAFEEMQPLQKKPQSSEPAIMQVNRGGGLSNYGETILHDRTFDTANGRVR